MIRNRTMRAAELETVLDWAAAEGWNPGLEDAEAFLAADPEGFFVAEDGDGPVAAISVVNHTPGFAFLGLYICRPDRRGAGIGLGLWQHALAHAGTRTVGLDGVPDQQANYRRSGFVLTGETTRYTGPLPPRDPAAARPASPADIDAIVALEAEASGVAKPAYLRAWLDERPTRRSFVLPSGDGLAGAITVRRCRDGCKIGPLVARDLPAAEALLGQAAAFCGGAPVSIDVPASAPALAALCAGDGMAPGFSTARMYRGPAPAARGGLYAVTSLELG